MSGWSWPKGDVKWDLGLILFIMNTFCSGCLNQWQISGMWSVFFAFHQSHIACRVSNWSDVVDVEGSVITGLMGVICIVRAYQSFPLPLSPGANF